MLSIYNNEGKENPTKITPKVMIKDDYGNEYSYSPPGWMWVLAFAIRGCQWAIDEINSGKFDGELNQGAYI